MWDLHQHIHHHCHPCTTASRSPSMNLAISETLRPSCHNDLGLVQVGSDLNRLLIYCLVFLCDVHYYSNNLRCSLHLWAVNVLAHRCIFSLTLYWMWPKLCCHLIQQRSVNYYQCTCYCGQLSKHFVCWSQWDYFFKRQQEETRNCFITSNALETFNNSFHI